MEEQVGFLRKQVSEERMKVSAFQEEIKDFKYLKKVLGEEKTKKIIAERKRLDPDDLTHKAETDYHRNRGTKCESR